MRKVGALACAIAGIVLGASLAASADASRHDWETIVPACASTRLPADILEGPIDPPRKPLALVDGTAPHATLRLAVADDVVSREYGLMCVLRMRPQNGMIFVFSRESEWEFWMKNTLVPLDMVWVRADGTVTTVAANVPASTRTALDTSLARRRGHGLYVIELRANEAAADGIVVGSHLALPPLRADR
jgi:uncharacterized membrane protein (UPF0127 family)